MQPQRPSSRVSLGRGLIAATFGLFVVGAWLVASPTPDDSVESTLIEPEFVSEPTRPALRNGGGLRPRPKPTRAQAAEVEAPRFDLNNPPPLSERTPEVVAAFLQQWREKEDQIAESFDTVLSEQAEDLETEHELQSMVQIAGLLPGVDAPIAALRQADWECRTSACRVTLSAGERDTREAVEGLLRAGLPERQIWFYRPAGRGDGELVAYVGNLQNGRLPGQDRETNPIKSGTE